MKRCLSEVDELKQVIIHKPDDGLEMITPSKADEMLFDDIVYLNLMQEEHEIFTDILRGFLGSENVKDTQELLLEVMQSGDQKVRDKFLQYIYELEELSSEDRKTLSDLSPEELVYTVFTGILKKENRPIFDPLPNYVFTRDIGVVINDHLLITNPSKEARKREAVLTRCICYRHPMFSTFQENDKEKIIDMTHLGDDFTIEGGDVIIFENEYLLVGYSERTTQKAFEELKNRLFEKNAVKYIVKIGIPKARSCMHIDTLFTQISREEFVIFNKTLTSKDILVEKHTSDGKVETYDTLQSFFHSIRPNMKFILCGDGTYPFDEREQWTDGCNLVALRDGVAVSYERNIQTAKALKKAGYTLIDGREVAKKVREGKFDATEYQKAIIQIPSAELSRARGGPHCMTFPIDRG